MVEDTAEIREIYRRVLTTAGYHILMARDGADGVCQAKRYRPDLIIMDISLPVLDGLAAAQELKSDAAFAHIPIIFVSGDAFAAHRVHAAGGAMLLAKPVRLTELLAAVARTLPQNVDERQGLRVTRSARRATNSGC